MKTKVYNLEGNEVTNVDLPPVFDFPYRPEIIKKVYVNLDSHHYQKQGRYPAAGEIVSAESRNTGLGIARLARAKGDGFSRAGQAAGVAGVRKGRLAHPPESWKVTYKKINKKEKRIALYSSISSTTVNELAKKRGHAIEGVKSFPLVVVNEIETIKKTKDFLQVLTSLGIENDLKRVENSIKRRSGKSRMRGRSIKMGKSAIVVVGTKESPLLNLNESIPGITVKFAKNLSVLDLAPGSKPIRLAIYSQNALDILGEIKLPSNILLGR